MIPLPKISRVELLLLAILFALAMIYLALEELIIFKHIEKLEPLDIPPLKNAKIIENVH